MSLLSSRTLTVSINALPERVAAFVRDGAHLPRCATAFCRAVRPAGDDGLSWIVQSPLGDVPLRFVAANPWGICDHWVRPAPDIEVFVPLRVVANGSGSEVIFTLFQSPDMDAADFARDVGMVERDLRSLRDCLER